MGALFELVIHLMINLMLIKLIFFRGDAKKPLDDSLSWKSAVDSMNLMETRIEQLQLRDIRQQERTWALEDLNRDLQQRVSRLTKELLLARPVEQPPFDCHDDDDPDDDRYDSIPTN